MLNDRSASAEIALHQRVQIARDASARPIFDDDLNRGYAAARMILHSAHHDRATVLLAVDTLSWSRDPGDMRLVSEARAALNALPGAELGGVAARLYGAMQDRASRKRNRRYGRLIFAAIIAAALAIAIGLTVTKAMANTAHGQIHQSEFQQ